MPQLANLTTTNLKWRESDLLVVSLVLLFALACFLRFYALDRWSLWLDETVQYLYASKPLSELYEMMDAYAAPLSLELSRLLVWLGLDGSGGTLRLPSAIFGIATVVLIYFLARELFGRLVAWFAALAACLMPVLVVYSQEYRPYSLLIFLSTLASLSLAIALRTNAPAWWWAFTVATILNLYTHFVTLPAFVGLGIFAFGYLVLQRFETKAMPRTLISAFLSFATVAIAYIPALPRLARLFAAEAKDMGRGGPGWGIFKLAYIDYPGFGGWLALIVAAVAALGIIWSGFRSPRALFFFLGTLGVSVALFYGHNHVVTSPRYVSFVMPSFAVAIGAGMAALTLDFEVQADRAGFGGRYARAIAVPTLTLLFLLASVAPLSKIYAHNPKQLPVDLREGYGYIRKRIKASDLLLQTSTKQGGDVYWYGFYDSYFMRKGAWPKVPSMGLIDNTYFLKDLARHLAVNGRLWVLMTVSDDQESSVRERGGEDFGVQCFQNICAIQSRQAEQPMLDQLVAFFDRYTDLDPQSFDKADHAVRAARTVDKIVQ